MAVAQRMTEADYVQFVSAGVDGVWELHDGRLVEKPGMSWDHGRIITKLISSFDRQLDPKEYAVFTELRIRRATSTVFLPDLMVVPTAYGETFRDRPVLAMFPNPLPLVAEVWSASTGDYDVDIKIRVYMQRGDEEIWRIHPYERTLTRWVRQPDGTYLKTIHREGTIEPVALMSVTIDLDALFAG